MQSAKRYLALVTPKSHSKCPPHLSPRMPDAPIPRARHYSLQSTFHKPSAQEPLAVPICARYTRTPESASPGCRYGSHGCLAGARLPTLLPVIAAIPWAERRLLGQGLLGRGVQTPGHGRGWEEQGGLPESYSGQAYLLPSSPGWPPLPHGYCFPPTTLLRPLT